jgi:MFS family permease
LGRLGWNYRKLLGASAVSNLGDGVGQIAYPWLASAVTRNPLLIALVAVVQNLPWLLFTLPAGVITDRHDRRRLMYRANLVRTVLTAFVGLAVLGLGGDLPGPDELTSVVTTDAALYVALLAATLLLGMCEVLHDNAGQTFMPSIVDAPQLERANGRLYSAELLANRFIGPALGSLLLAVGFAVPFFVDAGSFAVAAVLVALIAPPRRAARPTGASSRGPWSTELRAGVRWLWDNEMLRTLAVALGAMNGVVALTTAAFVLFCQEVLDAGPTEYALITVVGAVGGLVAGWLSGPITSRVGSGAVLRATLVTSTVVSFVMGWISWWPVAAVLLGVEMFTGVLWNVVTVSLRQSLIPDELLGRVNSVYRFFGWGAIPIGALAGGAIVAVAGLGASREVALRWPWWIGGLLLLLFVAFYAFPRLTTADIDAARREGAAGPTAMAETPRHDAQTAT